MGTLIEETEEFAPLSEDDPANVSGDDFVRDRWREIAVERSKLQDCQHPCLICGDKRRSGRTLSLDDVGHGVNVARVLLDVYAVHAHNHPGPRTHTLKSV